MVDEITLDELWDYVEQAQNEDANFKFLEFLLRYRFPAAQFFDASFVDQPERPFPGALLDTQRFGGLLILIYEHAVIIGIDDSAY